MNLPTTVTPDSTPEPVQPRLHAQSLAEGAAGTALLHVERARRGLGSWTDVHTAFTTCTRDLITSDDAALYLGPPAVAFALHTASTGTGHYTTALHTLDTHIARTIRRRLDQAHARIDRQERPRLAEFDLFYGLSGLGAYLLCRDPNTPALRDVLAYLVRLTRPLDGDTDHLPGWWTLNDPSDRTNPAYVGGHGNLGMAHGIAGPLALLSTALRAGVHVDDQTEAITRICAWLDQHHQDHSTGPWWPHWITLAEHRTGTITATGPLRPSWCYGTPGLARAQQLAGLALGDTTRQAIAEHALLACLTDPAQIGRIRDPGLCHGAAGLLHTTRRVANDALIDGFAEQLPHVRTLLANQPPADDNGFLDGTTGVALAQLADSDRAGTTASGWDACLLAG